jgi:CheY-like chemotaxis protein
MSNDVILIVDDNRDDVLLMRCALRRAGIENPVTVAQDGKEAIDYLRGSGKYADREANPLPLLALVETRLPRLDGFEVIRWIREHDSLREMPVIGMTGARRDVKAAQRAFDLGANFWIEKPLGYGELVSLIKSELVLWLPTVCAAA